MARIGISILILGFVLRVPTLAWSEVYPKIQEKMCRAMDGVACVRWGNYLRENGQKPLARQKYEMACRSLKYVEGCVQLAILDYEADQNASHKSKLQSLCQSGAGLACSFLGTEAAAGNNLDLAAQYFRIACKLEVGLGCYGLGLVYDQTKNESQTVPLIRKAIELLRKDCRAGDTSSCNNQTTAERKLSKIIPSKGRN